MNGLSRKAALMLKVTTYNRTAINMLKRKAIAQHRKAHIENARIIRENAATMRKAMLNAVWAEYRENAPAELYEEIEAAYNDAMLAAIAEENSACMDRH
jgi:TRAP-type C4-dicarboxylate transport system substrate-binding protein